MKQYVLGGSILALALCGTANARSIVYDGLSGFQSYGCTIASDPTSCLVQVISSSVNPATGGTLDIVVDGYEYDLGFSPDAGLAGDSYNAVSGTGATGEFKFNWGPNPVGTLNSGVDPATANQEQVVIYQGFGNSPDLVTVDFNYLTSTSCSGPASFSLGSVSYTSLTSLCGNAQTDSNGSPDGFGAEITLDNGVITSSLSGWTEGTPVSAPEIDPNSAASALTLLLGGLAVLRGRRRSVGAG